MKIHLSLSAAMKAPTKTKAQDDKGKSITIDLAKEAAVYKDSKLSKKELWGELESDFAYLRLTPTQKGFTGRAQVKQAILDLIIASRKAQTIAWKPIPASFDKTFTGLVAKVHTAVQKDRDVDGHGRLLEMLESACAVFKRSAPKLYVAGEDNDYESGSHDISANVGFDFGSVEVEIYADIDGNYKGEGSITCSLGATHKTFSCTAIKPDGQLVTKALTWLQKAIDKELKATASRKTKK